MKRLAQLVVAAAVVTIPLTAFAQSLTEAQALRDRALVRIVQPAGPGRYADAAGTSPHRGLRVVLGVSAGRVLGA